jgi:hypothetical protein
MQTKKITGEDVLDIQQLPGVREYSEDTQMKGQKYRRFSYNGVVFIVNTEDAFCQDFDNGQVYAVTFGINAEGQFSKLAHNNYTQVENLKKFEAKIKSFDRVEVITNPEELAGL